MVLAYSSLRRRFSALGCLSSGSRLPTSCAVSWGAVSWGAFLTPRPRQFGPAVVDVSASGHLVVDGEYVRAFDLGKLPPSFATDWAAPLLDGDLPLDVSLDVEPLDLAWAKLQLDARRNALESSAPTPGRQVALEQGFR